MLDSSTPTRATSRPPDLRTKYIRAWNAASQAYDEEAYDLVLDPCETQDLFPDLAVLPPGDRAAILALRAALIELSGS